MNILCLNTAFDKAHIALEYNGKQFFTVTDANCKHSENLLVEIEKLIENAKPENQNSSQFLKQLDAIAVVVGPGSFTGLRISIATAKAIMVANPNIKAVSIGSLELIAKESFLEEKTAILDALSGFYFVSSFKNNNCIEPPKMITSNELTTYSNFVSIEALNLASSVVCLKPETLLNLAKEKANNQQFVSETELLPLYIRPSQAEANFCGNKK